MGSVRKSLILFVNGRKFDLTGVEPDETLSSFLRRNGLTGSKIGCQEGVCGSCAVCVGRWDTKTNKAYYMSANACLTPLFLLDRASILTAEGIGSPEKMHPLQERLARGHGTQCGYCSPGFVMAAYSLLRNNPTPSDYELRQAIRGNICRCTGYRPIVEALSTFSAKGCCGGSKNGRCCMTEETITEERLVKWEDFPTYDPTQEILFPPELIKLIQESSEEELLSLHGSTLTVHAPESLSQLDRNVVASAKFVSSGLQAVHARNQHPGSLEETWVSLHRCRELQVQTSLASEVIFGAALSLSEVREIIAQFTKEHSMLKPLLWLLDQFSSTHVRNMASWAGSLLSGQGDFYTAALAFGLKLYLFHVVEKHTEVVVVDESFFEKRSTLFDGSRIIMHAILDLGMIQNVKTAKLDEMDAVATLVQVVQVTGTSRIAVGGIADRPMLVNRSILGAVLEDERLAAGKNAVYLPLLVAQADREKNLNDPIFESLQIFQVNNNEGPGPVGRPIAHQYADRHTTGDAVYTGDIRVPDMLHLAPVMSTEAHAEIVEVDTSEALKLPGVIDYVDYNDIPGTNIPGMGALSDMQDDTPVFANGKVEYFGQIIGAIVAESPLIARKAAKLVRVTYKKLPAILTIDEAVAAGSYFSADPHRVVCGEDPDTLFVSCAHVVEGFLELNGQQHAYMEPQSALCVPQEGGEWLVYTATQSPALAQLHASLILGIPKHRIVVKVKRVGGAFGGKVGGQCGTARSPALVAANKLKRPVSCVFTREEDFLITGGRHPAAGNYKIGCDMFGHVVAAKFNVNVLGGYSMDSTIFVGMALCTTGDGCYRIPNLCYEVHCCKTNTASNTAMRGFGQPQANFFIEHAMDRLARAAGFEPEAFRELNFEREGAKSACGDPILHDNLQLCWSECKRLAGFDSLRKDIVTFNAQSPTVKRGLAMVGTRFGIMHGRFFEQAFVTVQAYVDGSVTVSIGGIEMGQGLNVKVLQVACQELGLPMERVNMLDSATDRNANAPVTGGSSGADLYGTAVKRACRKLLEGLKPIQEANPGKSWEEIVRLANLSCAPLSVGMHVTYPREEVGFDSESCCYRTTGAACVVVDVDTLTGEHVMKSVQIVLDTGHSLNPAIDIGQIEGGFLQMYGLMTCESTRIDSDGRPIAGSLRNYKMPRACNVPEKFHVLLIPKPNSYPGAVYSSKSTGEPPLMLGSACFFAIKDALASLSPTGNAEALGSLTPPLSPLNVSQVARRLTSEIIN